MKEMEAVGVEDDEAGNQNITEEKHDSNSQTSILQRLKRYTKREWLIIASVCYVNFATNVSFSQMSAFFALNAEEHGLSSTTIGIIFGCYALVVCLFSPVVGSLIPKVGTKTMFICGQMVSGVFSLLISQSFRISSPVGFAAVCIICRIVQGFSCAAYFSSSFVTVAQTFRDNITFVVSLGETCSGLGMICGPIIGGWLYKVGGFQLPFMVVAGVMFFGAVLNYIAIENNEKIETSGNFFSLLTIPDVVVSSFLHIVMLSALDFNLPLLADHLKEQKQFSTVLVGLMFMMTAFGFGFSTPFVSFCTKSKASHRIVRLVGGIVVATGFLLIGPSPIFVGIHFDQVTLWNVSVSMILIGIGEGLAIVPTFNDMYYSAVDGNMQDNLSTSGVVGGLYTSSLFLGEFIGPVIAGALMDHLKDYKTVTSIYSTILFFIILAVATYYLVSWARRKTRSEVYQSSLVTRKDRNEYLISDENLPLLSDNERILQREKS